MFWNTVSDRLRSTLIVIMDEPLFDPFRLVGGTSLSLQLGHRVSDDIDLFTDLPYETIDLMSIETWFRNKFPLVESGHAPVMGMGHSFFVGNNTEDQVKVDVYHTDPFIRPALVVNGVRMAGLEDIAAMKLDIVGRGVGSGGRMKDFWDLHALLDRYTIPQMLDFYGERYPYGHSREEIIGGLKDFSVADDDFHPNCLLGKHWELIKLDMVRIEDR